MRAEFVNGCSSGAGMPSGVPMLVGSGLIAVMDRTQGFYVMGVQNGRYKVGVAFDAPMRLKELQTGNPEPIQLLMNIDTACDGVGARVLEKAVHELLSPYLIRGEWFAASFETIDRAVSCAWARLLSAPVAETTSPVVQPDAVLSDSEIPDIAETETRQARWRARNKDRYNAYMREYMRGRRRR